MLATVMTINRTWGNTEEQIYDRSYRLQYNKGQVLMDKVCSYDFPCCEHLMQLLNLELGVFGGLITLVCSYI